MLQKLGPALIGAVIGMALYWGMTKLMGDAPPAGGELRRVSVALPAPTPVEAAPANATGAEGSELTAGIRGADGSNGVLTAGIRGAETEMVGTMADHAGAAPQAQGTACVDHEARPAVVVAPDYPQAARQDGREAAVEVEFTVGADGKPADAKVVQPNPDPEFDRAAVAALEQWRFEPRTQGCAPVEARMRQQLQFRAGR